MFDKRMQELVQKYLDGIASTAELRELDTLLAGDPRAAQCFAEATRTDANLTDYFNEAEAASLIADKLKAIERNITALSDKRPQYKETARSGPRFAPLKSRMARSRIKPKQHMRTAWQLRLIGSAVAAVALVVLYFVLSPNPTTSIAVVIESPPGVVLERANALLPVQTGTSLFADDVVRVPSGLCQLKYADGTLVTLRPGSAVHLNSDGRAASVGKQIFVELGAVAAEVAKQAPGEPMRFYTPHSETAVVGTRLDVSVTMESTRVSVQEGAVKVAPVKGTVAGVRVDLPAGSCAVAASGAPVNVRKFVQVPYDWRCPVIYTNDSVDDVFFDEYVMALASAGDIQLKGIITTFHPAVSQHSRRVELVEMARRSGMRNLPDPVLGAAIGLKRPESGRIEDTRPLHEKAAQLILAEARKATLGHPLVILSGGSLTNVADAYLQDNSISRKVVVAAVGGSAQDMRCVDIDPWAAYIVLKKIKYVQIASEAVPAPLPAKRLAELPPGELRDAMMWKNSSSPFYARFGAPRERNLAAIMLVRADCALEARRVSFGNFQGEMPVFKDDPNGTALICTKIDANAATEEFWRAMKNPAAYHGE